MKYIVDVQDLWPEAFCMAIKNKWLQKLFYPMELYINSAYSKADCVIAVSKTYVNRVLSVNRKVREGICVYLGNNGQLFDEGRLTDNSGQLINFKNVIIIMTSNVGAREASELGKGVGFTSDEGSNKRTIIEKSLKNKFAPEFINRIDNIVYFNSLSDDNLKEIVRLEMEKFRNRMNELKFDFTYTDSVINFLHELCVKDKEYGARPIIRLIQNNIEDKVTDLLLMNEYNENYCFKIDYINNELTIE